MHIYAATPVSYSHAKVKAYIEWQEVYILYDVSWILVSDSFVLFSATNWIYGNELNISWSLFVYIYIYIYIVFKQN